MDLTTASEGPPLSKGRIPSLDGLRAFSIGLVVVGHLPVIATARSPVAKVAAGAVGNGDLGVTVFFVISGFLITTLLVRELDANDTIRLSNFYVRRIARIFPAYYTNLAIVLLLAVLGATRVRPDCWLSSALFFRNYYPPVEGSHDWLTAHYWSLSVEEQFYLLWPSTLALLGKRRATILAAALICLTPFSRVVSYFLMPAHRAELTYYTHVRLDSLMFGCLAALAYRARWLRASLVIAYRLKLAFFALVFILFVSPQLAARFGGAYYLTIGLSVEAASITLILLWTIEHSDSPAGKLLNARVVVHVGLLSYSLYLWQQLFTSFDRWWSVIGAFAAAEASYHLIERPILRRVRRG